MGTASSTAEGKTTWHMTGHMASSAKGIATGDTFVNRAACSRLTAASAAQRCPRCEIILGSQMISMLHCTNQQQQPVVLTKLSSTSQQQLHQRRLLMRRNTFFTLAGCSTCRIFCAVEQNVVAILPRLVSGRRHLLRIAHSRLVVWHGGGICRRRDRWQGRPVD